MPSPSSVSSWISELARSLDGFDEVCTQVLAASPVIGADETPIRVTPVQSYAHVVVSDLVTRFHLGDRSAKAIKSGGVLEGYPGTLVSDCYSSYWSITTGAHQACVAHLQRELRFFRQILPTELVSQWGLDKLSLVLKDAVARRRSNARGLTSLTTRYVHVGLAGITAAKSSAPPSTTEDRLENLLKRIKRLNQAGELYSFVSDPEVPSTNNWAERALRPLKVKQKRSGCFRSVEGAREHLRIAGYLDTARKNGVDPIDALTLAIQGTPVMPRAPALAL
jgi:transposase